MVTILKKRGEIPGIVNRILRTYQDKPSDLHHLGESSLPDEKVIVGILEQVRAVIYPGYFGKSSVSRNGAEYYVGEQVMEIHEALSGEIFKALQGCHETLGIEACHEKAEEFSLSFLETIPEIREKLAQDVQAAFDGDPAASSLDEVIFSYPGVFAVTIYRIAHELYRLRIPVIPRMMSEYVHRETGIDIHPGAVIGDSFFIDHGTGVVIGETTEIGNNVKVYQGVTLGALSFKGGADAMRNKKRHPTVGDNVVIYAGATILGGKTVIGHDSVIGGNVWIINSLPPRTKVMIEIPKLKVRVND